MKKISQYLIITPAILIVACRPVYYVPNTVNTPLFQDKGELNLALTAGASEYTSSFGLNSAFSISHNAGIMFNLASFAGSDEVLDDNSATPPDNLNYKPNRSGQLAEIGIGYFKPFEANSNFIFETYVGYGQYSGNVAIDNRQSVSFGINRPFIQPTVGFKHKYVEMAIGARIVKLYYTNAGPSTAFLANEYETQRFNELNNKTLFEPFATLKAGTKTTKLQFQIVKAANNGNSNLAIDGVNFSVGLQLHFN